MKRTYSQGWDDVFGKEVPKKPPLEQTSKPAKTPKPEASKREARVPG